MVRFEDLSIDSDSYSDGDKDELAREALEDVQSTVGSPGDGRGLTQTEKQNFLAAIDKAGGFTVKLKAIVGKNYAHYGQDRTGQRRQFSNLFNFWRSLDKAGTFEKVRAALQDEILTPSTSSVRRHSKIQKSSNKDPITSPPQKPKSRLLPKKKKETTTMDNTIFDYDSDEESGRSCLCRQSFSHHLFV